MSALAGWAVEALVASALLMALVLALRGPVRRAFGPQVAYALWALPLLRLMLPPLPARWHEVATTPIAQASQTITVLMIDPIAAAPQAVSSLPSLGFVLGIAWAVGAALFLGWHLTRHARFCQRMIDGGEAIDRIGGVRVIATDAAPGPLAFGIVRRYVAFPRDFADRYDADERELALAHELGHHQRGDLAANWAALAVLALHWFNPIAWRAFRAFRADQELANDARVLGGRSAIDRHAYACAIVKAAHGGVVSAACHLHTINDLKGRLRMLTTLRASRRRIATGGAIVSTLVVAGLGLTASGTSAATALTEKVGASVGVDLQAAPPAPPVPAAPLAPTSAPAIVPDVPRAPPAPPTAASGDTDITTVRTNDGKTIRTRMIRRGDGQTIDLAGIPEVSEKSCVDGQDGGPKQFVINSTKGIKKVMVICTNRIEKAASEGATAGIRASLDAKTIRHQAMTAALTSVESSRAGIAANRDMPEADRREALAELDEALKELRAEMANPGND